MDPDKIQFSNIVNMDDPQRVLDEVKSIAYDIFPDLDFNSVNSVFRDIVRLFRGEYPGYRKCNTEYHDLKHTTDTLLAMARLIHGISVKEKNKFTEKMVELGLISALLHDTGYIQTVDDRTGTGAKYTNTHIRRSIEFMQKYFEERGYSKEDFINCENILSCTSFSTRIDDLNFDSSEIKILCTMLGTADLVGQMADRTYLEKLLFLFYEFQEGNVEGYENELDLLKKTLTFYDKTKRRLSGELGNVNKYMRSHFKARWDTDRDLYMESIDNHISYLKTTLQNHENDYRDQFRRGGIVDKLKEKGL
jgi:hypothetical protein